MSGTISLNTWIGEYRLVGFLGAGGMGEVYRGLHSKIGRIAAVKVLSQAACDPSFVERFLNEAQIQARLQHPNIVTLYDFLEYNGRPCIIMEYIEGETLTDRILARGSLPLSEAITTFKAIVEAIDYVHSQGIIHRDIKSTNVKISSTGHVKVLDFGIAKSSTSPQLTVTGGVIGTIQYLAPEQFRGETANERTDIWALGVLLYEMVTGHMPFEATTLGELLDKIGKANYVQPSVLNSAVPRQLQSIVARCLKKNPWDRYRSAKELLRDVNAIYSTEPSHKGQTEGWLSSTIPYKATLRRLQNIGGSASSPPPATLQTAPVRDQRTPAPVNLATGSNPSAVNPSPDRAVKGAAATSQTARWMMLIAAVAVLAVLGLYLLSSDQTQSSLVGTRKYTIDVNGCRAEVYKDGSRVGATPYQFNAKAGDQISVVLKADGYIDLPVNFSVGETRNRYEFVMEKKE